MKRNHKHESIFYANDNMSLEEIQKELLKLGVVYTGGIHAFKITERKDASPLVTLVSEDDGHFFIGENAPTFSSDWVNNLSELCQETIKVAKNLNRNL